MQRDWVEKTERTRSLNPSSSVFTLKILLHQPLKVCLVGNLLTEIPRLYPKLVIQVRGSYTRKRQNVVEIPTSVSDD